MVEVYIGPGNLPESVKQGCPLCMAVFDSMNPEKQELLMQLKHVAEANWPCRKFNYWRTFNIEDGSRGIWFHTDDMRFSSNLDLIEADGVISFIRYCAHSNLSRFAQRLCKIGWRFDGFN